MSIIELIEDAFAERARPLTVVPPGHPPTDIYADAVALERTDWRQTTCRDWEANTGAVYGFSPQAFCYFLPGIFCCGIRENKPELLVNDSLIQMLDRSNTPSTWDDFFRERWPLLNRRECEASQRWVLWLSESKMIADQSLGRAFDTLSILANSDGATPIALY